MPRQIRFTVDVSITEDAATNEHFVTAVTTKEDGVIAYPYCVSVQDSLEAMAEFVRQQIYAGVERV